MEKFLTDEEFSRMTSEYAKVKYKCRHCCRKVIIPVWLNKQICPNCGYYVFKTKKDEDLFRIKEVLKNKGGRI